MANNSIKGITIQIGGDTTGLEKALKDVDKSVRTTNKELREIERGLKFDPSNVELLAQKTQVLGQQIQNTSRRLGKLKDAQEQVNKQFAKGEISGEQYRAFNREIARTESALRSLEERAQKLDLDIKQPDIKDINVDVKADTSEINRLEATLESLPNVAKSASRGVTTALRNISTGALAGATAVGGITTAFLDTNQDLAMLETQLSQVKLNVDDVTESVTKFKSVGQQTDQITETFGNLVQAGYTTAEQIDAISTNIAGAIAKYGNTFSSEGLAESITSTVQLGEATGQLTDLLEKEGVNIDTFNAKMTSFATETERANYITSLLAQEGLAQLYQAYATGNPEIIAQAEAQWLLTQSMSDLTTALTPVLTALTTFSTALIDIVTGEKTAEEALDMLNEKLLELFPSLSEGGTTALQGFVEGMRSVLPEIAEFIGEVLGAIWEAMEPLLPDMIDMGMEILGKVLEGLEDKAPEIYAMFSEIMTAILEQLEQDMPRLLAIGGQLIMSMVEGFKGNFPQIMSAVASLLSEIIASIIGNLPAILEAGGEIIIALVQGIGQGVENLLNGAINGVIDALNLPFEEVDLSDIGMNIIDSLRRGIMDEWERIKGTIMALGDMLPTWLKDKLGIHSPSKVFRQLGAWTGEGMSLGLDDSQSGINKSMNELGDLLVMTAEKNAKDIQAVEKQLAKDVASLKKKDNASIQKLQEKAEKEKLKLRESENKTYLEAIESFIDNKKSLEELSLVEEAKIWERSLGVFKEGTEERIKVQENYKNAVEDIQNQILDINEEYQFKMQDIGDELIEKENELTKQYEDAYNKRYETLNSFTGLFDRFASESVSSSSLLYNLRSQVEGLEDYQEQLDLLSSKGINTDLFTEIQEMGVDALPQISALNRMTEKELDEYVRLYEEKSRLAKEQTEKEFEGLRNVLAVVTEGMRTEAQGKLDALQTEWLGKIQGIASGTGEQLQGLEQVGQNAGLSLIQGLSNMEGALLEKAVQVANNVNGAINGALQLNPQQVQAPTVQGADYGQTSQLAFITGKDVSNAFKGMKTDTEVTFDAMAEYLTTTMESYKVLFNESWLAVTTSTTTTFTNMYNTVMTTFTNTRNGVSGTLNTILQDVKTTFFTVLSFMQTIDFHSVGVSMIQSLIDGITSMQSQLIDSMIDTVEKAVESAEEVLGINSPSKVFAEIGEYTNEGFVVGLEKSSNKLNNAIDNLYGSMSENAQSMAQSSNTYNNQNSYDYSKSMNNNITIQSQQDSGKAVERALRRLAFSF